jgi:hypothetical protein
MEPLLEDMVVEGLTEENTLVVVVVQHTQLELVQTM